MFHASLADARALPLASSLALLLLPLLLLLPAPAHADDMPTEENMLGYVVVEPFRIDLMPAVERGQAFDVTGELLALDFNFWRADHRCAGCKPQYAQVASNIEATVQDKFRHLCALFSSKGHDAITDTPKVFVGSINDPGVGDAVAKASKQTRNKGDDVLIVSGQPDSNKNANLRHQKYIYLPMNKKDDLYKSLGLKAYCLPNSIQAPIRRWEYEARFRP